MLEDIITTDALGLTKSPNHFLCSHSPRPPHTLFPFGCTASPARLESTRLFVRKKQRKKAQKKTNEMERTICGDRKRVRENGNCTKIVIHWYFILKDCVYIVIDTLSKFALSTTRWRTHRGYPHAHRQATWVLQSRAGLRNQHSNRLTVFALAMHTVPHTDFRCLYPCETCDGFDCWY